MTLSINAMSASLPGASSYFSIANAPMVQTSSVLPTMDQYLNAGFSAGTAMSQTMASSMQFVQTGVPTMSMNFLSGYNGLTVQSLAQDSSLYRPYNSFEINQNYGAKFLGLQNTQFDAIYALLGRLRSNASVLQNPDLYNVGTASSSAPGIASATASSNALTAQRSVSVAALAAPMVASSSVYSNPYQALGLSGNFSVNGWGVNVSAGDTLFDIASRVNSGTPTPSGLSAAGSANGGALTAGTYYYRVAAVDAFGNETGGSAEASASINSSTGSVSLSWSAVTGAQSYKIYRGTVSGAETSYYISDGKGTTFTDINNSSALLTGSPSLNTSANNAFGYGGSAVRGVVAGVSGGQLLFTSTNGGGVSFNDPNGILQNLGVLFQNPANGSMAVNSTNPQYQAAQNANITVDGKKFTPATNGPVDVGGGISITANGTGSATITAGKDVTAPLRSALVFLESYNQAMDALNKASMNGGAISENERLQVIYSEMVKFLYAPPPSPIGGETQLADIGIKASGSEPTKIDENVLQNLVSQREQADPNMPTMYPAGAGRDSLLTQSAGIGVNSADNFKATVDVKKLADSLAANPSGVGALLDFAASRIQGRLDIHLQPDYGTIAFQKKVNGFYSGNQQDVASLMGDVVGITENRINSQNSKTLISSIFG